MPIEVEFDAAELERNLGRISGALDKAMRNTLDHTTQSIVSHARQTTRFRDRTGMLRNSIRAGAFTGSLESGNQLATDVIAGGGGVNYARFVHDGTRPHVIEPRLKKALRIPTGGGHVFAMKVNHPGTAPRPFMDDAAEAVEPGIQAIGEAWTTNALREIGLL